MTQLRERDAMVCRACGNEERASEGYPCVDCGTFICIVCSIRGVVRCRSCAAKRGETPLGAPLSPAEAAAVLASPLSPTDGAQGDPSAR